MIINVLKNISQEGKNFKGHKFVNCDVVADFTNADLSDVVFEDCIINRSMFNGANLSNVKFINTTIYGCIFTKAIMNNCVLL